MARIYRDYYEMYSISPDATDIEIEGILKPLLEKYRAQKEENGKMQREYSCICEAYQTLTKDRRLYDLEYQRRNSIIRSYQREEKIENVFASESISFKKESSKEILGEIVDLENQIHFLHERVDTYSNKWMAVMDLKREIPKKVAQLKEKIEKEKSYCDATFFLKEMEERETNPLKKLFIDPTDFEKKRVCLELISMYTAKVEDYKKGLEEEVQKKEEELHKKEGKEEERPIESFHLEELELFSNVPEKEEVGKVIA